MGLGGQPGLLFPLNLDWPTAGMGLGGGRVGLVSVGVRKKRKTISVEIALRLAQAPTTLYL